MDTDPWEAAPSTPSDPWEVATGGTAVAAPPPPEDPIVAGARALGQDISNSPDADALQPDFSLDDLVNKPISALKSMIPTEGVDPDDSSATIAAKAIDAVLSPVQRQKYTSKLMQTTGILSDPVQNATVDKLGAAGVPAAISAALGMAAGVAVNPTTYLMPDSGPIKVGNVGGDETLAREALATKMGVTLTPGQATQTRGLGLLEAFAYRYPYTSDAFMNFYKNQLGQADNVRSMLLDSVGNTEATKSVSTMLKGQIQDYLSQASPEDAAVLQDKFGDIDSYMRKPAAGQFTKSMLAQSRKLALDQAGAQFDALRDIVPDATPIPTPLFNAKANEFLQDELQSNPADQDAGWVKRLASYAGVDPNDPGAIAGAAGSLPVSSSARPDDAAALQAAIDKAGGAAPTAPAPTPFGSTQMTMQKLRDLRISNDPGYLLGIKGQGNTYAGYAAKLREAMHGDIQNGLQSLSDNAASAIKDNPPADPAIMAHLQKMAGVADQYSAATSNYAATKTLMNDPFIVKLLKNDPEDFLDHAVQPQDVSNVAKLKGILGDQNFAPVQQNLLANMLVDKTGQLNPTSFISKVDKIGYPTLTQVFDPKTLAEIANSQSLFRSMRGMERAVGQGSPTAGLLMAKGALMGLPTTAAGLLFSGHVAAAAGTVAAGYAMPKLIAQAYLSAPIRHLLIHGMASPESATMLLNILSKGAAVAGLNTIASSGQPAAASGTQNPPQQGTQ